MKVVALLPFRDERPFLPSYLSTVAHVADEVIALDDGSSDDGPEFLRSHGVCVERSPHSGFGGIAILRERLLELGRSHGGTHFVWLDADETFTAPFVGAGRELMASMEPGDKLVLRWLALWRSLSRFRDDVSPFGSAWKDFITCDDGRMQFRTHPERALHEPRTPGDWTEESLRRVDPAAGAVLHLQFVAWERYQAKQAWYRCLELLGGLDPVRINLTYRPTVDEAGIDLRPLPEAWSEGVVLPSSLEKLPADRFIEEVDALFQRHGAQTFEPLEIWHVPDLRQRFIEQIGRPPRPPGARQRFWNMRVRISSRYPALGRVRRRLGGTGVTR